MNTPTEAEKIEQILLQLVEDFMDFSDMETRHIWAKDKKVATAAISEMLAAARKDELTIVNVEPEIDDDRPTSDMKAHLVWEHVQKRLFAPDDGRTK